MKTLHITVEDKVAKYHKEDGFIVCGNNNYQIEFAFDEEWNGHNEKVARFAYGGKFQDVEFTGNVCAVPVVERTGVLEVGVYVKDELATTMAQIPCALSVLCNTAEYKPMGGNSDGENNEGYTVNFYLEDSHYTALKVSRTMPKNIDDFDLEILPDEENEIIYAYGELTNVKELYLWVDHNGNIDTVVSMDGEVLISSSGNQLSYFYVSENIIHINKDCNITVTNSY